jgi:F0F1-type ATP synthase assembly protein I
MNKKNNRLKYLSLSSQMLGGLLICVFGGIQVDKYFKFNIPIATWVFPLILISATIIKIVVDTSKKK